MRSLLVPVALFLACLWSDTFSQEPEGDIWDDLMTGRMWFMNDTGKSKDKHSEYGSAFKNFETDFGEASKVDLQDEESDIKSEENAVVLPKTYDNEQDEEEEDEDEDEIDQKPIDEKEAAIKKQKGSLVIVFDTTKSMSQELVEVKKGAIAIVESLRKHPEAPIYNYIFSPFNDPEVGPLAVTTQPDVLEKKMNDVVVQGGGDCPELAFTGLKNALDICLPNSKVYVFTDAPPKDVQLYKSIVALVQQKRVEVNFILTKGCISKNLDKLWPYDYVAQTSSGHLYKVKMEDLKNILNFVKINLKNNEVHLMSVNKEPTQQKQSENLPIYVDPSIIEFTVSVSGLKTTLDLRDEKDKTPSNMENLLSLSHLKVNRVKNPRSGVWHIKVACNYPHMVRVTAISNLTFVFGFSLSKTDQIKNTNHRPLKGAKSYILIKTTNSKDDLKFDSVDILDLRGNPIETLPLEIVSKESNLYRAAGFSPPNKFFNLRINGIDKNKVKVNRISPTAISSKSLGPPIVKMRKSAVRKLYSRGSITCDIESLAPVVIGWKKNDAPVDKKQVCSEACEAILHFSMFTYKTQGNYTCFAENSAGSDFKVLRLRVGKPPTIKSPGVIYAELKKNLKLKCKVNSTLPFKVLWKKYTADSKHAKPVTKGKVESDWSLTIPNFQESDAGIYVCKVSNKAGKAKGHIDVKVAKN